MAIIRIPCLKNGPSLERNTIAMGAVREAAVPVTAADIREEATVLETGTMRSRRGTSMTSSRHGTPFTV